MLVLSTELGLISGVERILFPPLSWEAIELFSAELGLTSEG